MKKAIFAALVAVMMARPALAYECRPEKETLAILLAGQFLPDTAFTDAEDKEFVTFVNPAGIWVTFSIPKKGVLCRENSGEGYSRARDRES